MLRRNHPSCNTMAPVSAPGAALVAVLIAIPLPLASIGNVSTNCSAVYPSRKCNGWEMIAVTIQGEVTNQNGARLRHAPFWIYLTSCWSGQGLSKTCISR